MTIRRPRLTARRLMTLVALAGVVLGGLDLIDRRRGHARAMMVHHQALVLEEVGSAYDPNHLTQRAAEQYHFRMMKKWQAAADRPWLPFEADPPPPE